MKTPSFEDTALANYIFRNHSAATLRRWAEELQYFRFFRSPGGHADEGDSLEVHFRFSSAADLRVALETHLGITLAKIPEAAETPQAGKTYTGDEWAQLATPIPDLPEYEQPKRITLNGVPVFCYVLQPNTIELSLSGADGDDWSVTQVDIDHAKKIEALISATPQLIQAINRSRETMEHCLTVDRINTIAIAAGQQLND